MKRRNFIKNAVLSSTGLAVGSTLVNCADNASKEKKEVIAVATKASLPLVIATWHVIDSTAKAMEVLQAGGSAIDAVEQGCMVEEANEKGQSVGKGGLPDRDGNVTLDACVMDHNGDAGSVMAMEDVVNPISVARAVMEDTPHVILAGEGAQKFAFENGFTKTKLLTEKSKAAWQKWLETAQYKPIINIEMHDTIGMIGRDKNGNMSGGCSTSGLAYKMRGRVGDSPVIGSGLFVDNAVGAATATGLGEEVIKTVGSFLMVELMRQGHSPQAAAQEAIKRIVENNGGEKPDFQVGYLCFNKKGEIGAYSIHPGFGYVLHSKSESGYTAADSHFEKDA